MIAAAPHLSLHSPPPPSVVADTLSASLLNFSVYIPLPFHVPQGGFFVSISISELDGRYHGEAGGRVEILGNTRARGRQQKIK